MSRLPMLLASACGVQLFKRSFAAAAASGSFTGRIPIEELHIREGCSVNGRPLSDSPSGSTARVEIRFNLAQASFIPQRLKPRLVQLYSDRISRDGQFVVASDRTRKRLLNRADCMETIRECVRQAEAAAAEPATAQAGDESPVCQLAHMDSQAALARPFSGNLSFSQLRL
ncbi:hypothetical protein BOX15_Mlig028226g2 [Macrostomum lignano]|uniref:Uncharacterized protein n=1 Tax=Macrostomum lignano TaxID=282301 RepID=A0A267EHW6_9PLAT|nr:hypothetical protein BOX15_Mlig028226g2 [Macrostomum lignano]